VTRFSTPRSIAQALAAVGAAFGLAALAAVPALAHGPDPLIPGSGTLWPKDTVATFQWAGWAVPPAWAAGAIDAGAADVAESRDSRAAVFLRVATSNAYVAYSGPNGCDTYGIACMDRTGMSVDGTFRVWFRPQGWAFDWGTLKWCQYYSSPPTGCYDIETTTLDELGHVEVLGHHVNFADDSDFTDAVVQYAGHTKPRAGWNQHVFGRCDIARLQLAYERRDPSNLVSTCVSLPSALTLTASNDSLTYGSSVKLTANLKIAISTTAEQMSGDPLSDRTVTLQRRPIGSTAWTTVTTLAASGTTEGAYSLTFSPTATYDWRVTFATPTNEGVGGATSGTIRIYVGTCTGAGCPLAAVR
jgi:hypothetical protein